MTKPAIHARSALLQGCAPAALTLALLAAPQAVLAQAFQATPTVTQGTVSIDRTVPDVDTIRVDGFDAVIDWTPFVDNNGAAQTFLPQGNRADFLGANGFAVLNRIQPTQLGTPAEFAGTVRAFLTDGQGNPTTPGGFVAFYSPTGILVSGTAVFEVPQLMLTTNAADLASFTDFATGAGPLLLSGATSSITIAPGATFTGTPEGSFFIVSSTNIDMAGDAYFNGSTAYVGALEAQLTHNSGLFDIVIPFASGSEGQAISHTGSTGGPESSGAGDNHVIYGVTSGVPSSPGVSMLFSGNLGFDVAAGATVANGEIILSGNYDVAGREIDGGLTGEGADSFFNGRTDPGFGPTQIVLDGVTATSDVTAISQTETSVTTSLGNSSFAGDLVIVGRGQASVRAGLGGTITVGEELYVSASNFGSTDGSQVFPVSGGSASVSASTDGLVSVAGRTTVTADAYAGVDTDGIFVGDAAGGFASISADGGTVQLGGDTVVSASALTEVQAAGYEFAGTFTGGFADFSMFSGGTIALDGGLSIFATAFTPDLTGLNAGLSGNSQGGNILIGGSDGGGFFSITNGFLVADASAGVGDGVAAIGAGPTAQGGSIFVSADFTSTFSVEGDTFLFANGFGGNVTGGGDGGEGIGGTIDLFFEPGTLFDGALVLDSYAQGGSGQNGGNGTGGTNTINVSGPDAVLTVNGISQSFAVGEGGIATGAGNGGLGTGGTAQLFLSQGAQLAMNGAEMQLNVDAFGGNAIGGAGGDALSGSALVSVDEATADFAGTLFLSGIGYGGDSIGGAGGAGTSSSASLLLQVANGSGVSIGNVFSQSAIGVGGNGISGGAGTGGTAGFAIDASSTLDLATTNINASGIGGDGTSGNGGDGIGGTIAADIDGGTVTASLGQSYSAAGAGGDTATGIGGTGTGGTSQINNVGGIINAPGASLGVDAGGIGGSATASGGSGGNGIGGDAAMVTASGGSSTVLSLDFTAAGTGGDSLDTLGGDGLGGQASVSTLLDAASLTVVDGIGLNASGLGGTVLNGGGTGGTGTGGIAFALASETADVQAGGLLTANAEGEGGAGLVGGDGIGGLAAAGALTDGSLQSGGAALSSDGIGAAGGIGGNGTGGDSLLVATTATLGFAGPVALSAQGFGGEDLGSSGAAIPAGGNATGGSAAIQLDAGAAFTGSSAVELNASAFGGNSLDGAGGAATAGDAAFDVANGAVVDIAGALGLQVAATGGTSGTGAGGLGTAGAATIAVDGLQTDVQLGGIAIGGLATGHDGSDATGGDVSITVSDTANLDVAGSTLIDLGALGGDDGGSGFGGNATGGNLLIDITGASASFAGAIEASLGATGGGATNGGDGIGGTGDLSVSDSTLFLGGSILVDASAGGGSGGGSGTGGQLSADFTSSTVTSAAGQGDLDLSANGLGDGTGGDGIGGTVSLGVAGSNLAIGSINLSATAAGSGTAAGGANTVNIADSTVTAGDIVLENGATATGGDAVTGPQNILIDNSPLTANGLSIQGEAETLATGGTATSGDAGVTIQNGSSASFAGDMALDASALALGDDAFANAGSATVDVLTGSTLDTGADLALFAEAYAGDTAGSSTGGEAVGGTASLGIAGAGSAVSVTGTTALSTLALGNTGTDATGGAASVTVADEGELVSTGGLTLLASAGADQTGAATGGSVTLETLGAGAPGVSAGPSIIDASASGGATAIAGNFDILATAGSIGFTSLDAQALGNEASPDASRIVADNGSIEVTGDLLADVTGDLDIEYANGGTILGGSGPDSLTASFDITASGTLTITGDDAAQRSFAANSLRLSSREVQIDPLANLGGASVEIVSLDTQNRNVIGGTTQEAGFTLTDSEIAAISADRLTITTPETADPDVDVELRDLNLVGSQAGGESEITFTTGGTMQIVGTIRYDAAAADDALAFLAGPSVQVVLPDASIASLDDGGSLSGSLTFSADNLIFTTADNLAIILNDPDDAAIPGLLGDHTQSGRAEPYSYIAAGSVSLAATDYIYGQNTGDDDRLGGIEVSLGGSGLLVGQIDPVPDTPPLRAILYGLASDSVSGTFEFDEEFFFNTIGSGTLDGPFDDAATLNDCLINTVFCPGLTPRPEDTPQGPIQNEVLVRNPVTGEQTGNPSRGYTSGFGVEFPGLFDAPLISEDERIDEPVTSGGDSALYTLGAQEDENEEDDEGGED